jgi:hypothetical protein
MVNLGNSQSSGPKVSILALGGQGVNSNPTTPVTSSSPVVTSWHIDSIGAQVNFGADEPTVIKYTTSISSDDKNLIKDLYNAAKEVGGEVVASAGAAIQKKLSVASVQLNIYASGTVSRPGKQPVLSECQIIPEVGPTNVNGNGEWWTVVGLQQVGDAFVACYKLLQGRENLIRNEVQGDLIANAPSN